MQSFPQPLSVQEEEAMLQGMKQGDSTCRNRLIEHNLRLVAHVVKKYSNSPRPKADAVPTKLLVYSLL